MRIFFSTLPVRGSIRPSVLSERSATQRLPAPYAIPNGRDEKAVRLVTLFVAGSIRTTRPRARSVVQIEPAAESTIPACAPTSTFAIGSSGAGAAAAQTAATPAATTPASTSPYFVGLPCIGQPCTKNSATLH